MVKRLKEKFEGWEDKNKVCQEIWNTDIFLGLILVILIETSLDTHVQNVSQNLLSFLLKCATYDMEQQLKTFIHILCDLFWNPLLRVAAVLVNWPVLDKARPGTVEISQVSFYLWVALSCRTTQVMKIKKQQKKWN